MKIAFNPSTVAALTTPPNNKDITFDLRGHSIFARGVEFKGTDTNTWRDIKINNVSIGSHTLDLQNGSNTTLTNTNGIVTINSTWRPVVDNLTSDSTTSSLSAKQGKVLKALIDGKSNSDHNHDGRYVRAFGTSNDNIDSDWGQSFKTFDPIPLGTPPEKNPNISLLSIGENFNRRKQLAFIWDNDNIYYRRRLDSGFTNWRRLAFANEIPTSLKNPYALTISLNGTSQGPYDGSAAKNINITPGSIGAAVSNHSHDYLVVNSADDKSFNSAYHNFQVLYAGGGNGITGKPANVDAFGLFKFRAASGWSGQMLLANGGSLYIRSSEDAKMTNTLAWKTILDSSNYSSTLDSRYYTESEVNSLLDAKLNRQNLSYGNWNPRGWNLAADYNYNGGDLSISENNGKMYVSVDGWFWQNEGQYRVLDTSDIGDIRNSVTLHQYLSATDAAWYPLIWGGASHNNTRDSTGAVYKSYDKLRWQTSSQTLYATNIQTNNIKNLSIGGGIYWNSYVESASEGSDAASITLVRSGVAGGTTLVLSQMNDTNDTIQFKTNTAARLYHNSYPILTTQDTYVNNNKGYINGTEITQVNNSDTLDNWHKDEINRTLYITSQTSGLSSYWAKLWEINLNNQYNDVTITFLAAASYYPSYFSIFSVYLRQNGSGTSKDIYARLVELIGNIAVGDTELRLYVNNTTGNCQLWGNVKSQYGTMNLSVLKKAWRTATDSSNIGTFFSTSFNSVQSLPGDGWYKVGVIQQGVVGAFNPAAHTHTVFKNNLMIKGTNGISDSASIHLGIGDSDTGFKWLSDGVCQIYAGNEAVGQWTLGGMNWFKNPTVNDNKVWNAGNDGSGSGLDADTLDGEHASSFVRAGHYESQDLNKLDTYSFIRSVNSNVSSTSPKGNTGWYNVIQLVHRNGASDGPSYIGQIALGMTTNTNDMFFRGKRTDPWKTVIHSGNIGNQTVANAYHLRINSANSWSTWYWAGQSSQPSWLWGSNDGTNMYVWDPSNFRVAYAASAGNADTLDGYPANGSNDRPYGHIPTIESDGVMEVGRYIDFHNDNNGKHDFSTRLQSTGNYGNEVNLPSASGTLALINDVNNYYWANVKISTSSSTTTSPTVLNLTATNSIRMGNILLEHTNEINNSANDSIHLNLRNSGNVSLCVGGGKVGIGTMYPSQELYVLGYTHTKGFGIGIQYLSESELLPTISPGDGYTYRCLEIGRPTKVSCIIADKVPLSGVRGILLKFMQGFDGQIVLLKDLENYGSGNGYFWVMPSGCKIINADNSNILINQNQISNIYDDGRSRFFIYSSKYSAWIEFFCSNIY